MSVLGGASISVEVGGVVVVVMVVAGGGVHFDYRLHYSIAL